MKSGTVGDGIPDAGQPFVEGHVWRCLEYHELQMEG